MQLLQQCDQLDQKATQLLEDNTPDNIVCASLTFTEWCNYWSGDQYLEDKVNVGDVLEDLRWAATTLRKLAEAESQFATTFCEAIKKNNE